jgi:iron(III) transport system permease protein
VPMLKDTWVRVWLMLFCGVMFELPVSQLLYPPGDPTLAVSIVHQFNGQELGRGAALTVLSTSAVGLVALLVSWGLARLGRRAAGPGARPAPVKLEAQS